MCRDLHLSILNGNCQRLDQATKFCMSSCNNSMSALVSTLLKNFASSANDWHVLSTISGKSLIKITNKIGPRTEPWGIPLFTFYF